jgi:predicted lipoprotein with Yx(FWY)xxD motif
MPRFIDPLRRRRSIATPLLATAAAFLILAGLAAARTFTLRVAKHATVTNAMTGATKHEAIVVTSNGFAVYLLTGDSKRHPECTSSACLAIWPPVRVTSAKKLSKAPGIKGKLGTWRHHGFTQLTLAGHPLYRYAPDSRKADATGQGIVSFGGTWKVIKAG